MFIASINYTSTHIQSNKVLLFSLSLCVGIAFWLVLVWASSSMEYDEHTQCLQNESDPPIQIIGRKANLEKVSMEILSAFLFLSLSSPNSHTIPSAKVFLVKPVEAFHMFIYKRSSRMKAKFTVTYIAKLERLRIECLLI